MHESGGVMQARSVPPDCNFYMVRLMSKSISGVDFPATFNDILQHGLSSGGEDYSTVDL